MAGLNLESRSANLKDALEFGNHTRATKNPELLREFVYNDTTHIYNLVLPLSKVQHILGLLMAPIKIQKQNMIDEHGRIVVKDCLTHGQSYQWGS